MCDGGYCWHRVEWMFLGQALSAVGSNHRKEMELMPQEEGYSRLDIFVCEELECVYKRHPFP